jgi:hypothetical protein
LSGFVVVVVAAVAAGLYMDKIVDMDIDMGFGTNTAYSEYYLVGIVVVVVVEDMDMS